jgi:hypothetical protein
MLLPCSQARAVFAPEGLQLSNPGPTAMLWDEHGGTFVLKVSDLVMAADAAGAGESGILLTLVLNDPQARLPEITGFARQHSLALASMSPPPAEVLETPMLAAFHVPERHLFIYCEAPTLRVRASGPQTLELAVTGEFLGRRVPCREADVVIHLSPGASARVLNYCAAWLKTLK